MTAKQALKLSKIGVRKSIRAAKKRAKALRNPYDVKKVDGYYSNAIVAIEKAAEQGNFWVSFKQVENRDIADRVANKLRGEGFAVEVFSDTVFTGVDDWEDYFQLLIRWEKA